ncbi:hypothetical protein M3Y95_00602900 [Aphelenchoides besseyi]|nr:hypothetical protein M3Y95_00602900 [Aphelenchoides besseyi]
MTLENQLYARAILLEEYRNGTEVEKAVERVQAELGPNSIGEDATNWYKLFQSGNEKIAESADVADCYLVENGTFLRSKRSLVTQIAYNSLMCRTYGLGRRFQIVSDVTQENWIVDTFNGHRKLIRIDLVPIDHSTKSDFFKLEIMYFTGRSTVCGVVYSFKLHAQFWFMGTFDDINIFLRIELWDYLAMNQLTLYTQAQSAILEGFSDRHFHSSNVDLATGRLSVLNSIDMQYKIWSPIRRNDKLFGFPYENETHINTKKLYELTFIDGSKIEHEIEEKNKVEIEVGWCSSLWIDDQLLVGVYDPHKYVSTVYKFDISQMKWTKTTIEVKNKIEAMTVDDGLLIVHANVERTNCKQIYCFQYKAVDTLVNLIRLSMRRYSNQNPSFHEWFMSKLPKNHKLRPL